MANSMNRSLALMMCFAALVLAGLWLSIPPGELVVYCAHDEIYSQQILDEFTRETGIRVRPRFDTEATKSLGLINLILQERQQSRCDVFWNNELLGMVELREQRLLEAYQGTGWRRMPEQFRDADGYWVGFGARLRVYIVNTQQAAADEKTFHSLITLDPERLAMAKPLFGTTLTQYTVMWKLWGPDRLKSWHADLRLRGLREVDGNAAVKDIVAIGSCDAGMTDNDDYFVAVDDNLPVAMQPIRLAAISQGDAKAAPEKSTYTICIPNTVGIIKGTRHLAAARRLADYLASAQTELALAKAKSRQIPLGPVDPAQLPEDVRKLTAWAGDGIDLRDLLPERRACLEWLQQEYVK